MSRDTLDRQWTPEEKKLARDIVQAVALGEGSLVGSLSVARAVGLPWSKDERRTSIAKIHDVMPEAVRMSREMYPATSPSNPGRVLIAYPDRTYRLVSGGDPQARLAPIRRVKAAHTKLVRTRDELEVVGDTPSSRWLCQLVKSVVVLLDPNVINGAVADAEQEATDG